VAEKAKTAVRTKQVQVLNEVPCPKCGKPTRIVKRVKNRAMGIAGGMYLSCTACDFAAKR
jgi:ssDNA-binding Zn-finger/Zn-ribbon topoisomerase 1